MEKIERVITALELCTDISQDGCMMLCPYKDEQDETYPGLCEHIMKQDVLELLKAQQPRLLTFEEVKDHYSVPISKADIERYNDYAEDIKPLYFEFPICDGWEVHWRGYDKVSAYLREWEKDYGRTWRCWTDKPTDEQRKAEPWKDGE